MKTGNIRAFVLRYLRRRDGAPATEELLLIAIESAFGEDITRTEAQTILNDMEAESLLSAATHPVLKERSYTLTTAGQHAANQLR